MAGNIGGNVWHEYAVICKIFFGLFKILALSGLGFKLIKNTYRDAS